MKRLTILHVEDSRLVADAVKKRLEAEGWTVELCVDGHAALDKLARSIHYDLLLLDNGLPYMSGLELTRHARKLRRYRRTPIIMLSADELTDEAKAAGVDLFLRKPDDVAKLVDAVRSLLRVR